MDIEKVTNLPPRTLMLVVGGGVAAGFLWRYMASRNQSVAPQLPDQIDYLDDYNNTALETVGNRRDLYGSGMDLPLQGYLYRGANGQMYTTDDAGNLIPIGGSTGVVSGDDPIESVDADAATNDTYLYEWTNGYGQSRAKESSAARYPADWERAKDAGRLATRTKV